jgi:hypothetical protein
VIRMTELEKKIKTEYRIVTAKTDSVKRYLQFKSKEQIRKFPDIWNKKEVECWRYIPEENIHFFSCLSEEDCPTFVSFFTAIDLVCSSYNLESYDLIPFTKRFPNINDYFSYIGKLREEHLAKEEKAKNAETIYLNR